MELFEFAYDRKYLFIVWKPKNFHKLQIRGDYNIKYFSELHVNVFRLSFKRLILKGCFYISIAKFKKSKNTLKNNQHRMPMNSSIFSNKLKCLQRC